MIRSTLCVLALLAAGCQSAPKGTYKSPEAAVDSLVNALRTGNTVQLDEIFGKDGAAIASSGDVVDDRNNYDKFIDAYDARHELTLVNEDEVTLVIGKTDWPFPVPIVKENGRWLFDTAAGKDEILNRRIGRNELETIQVCLAIVDAQREYARLDPNGAGLPVYAQRVISEPGKKNGLYWPTPEGTPPSPLGPLVAQAAEEGYATTRPITGEPAPYHGYHYRLLTSQGEHAPGGKRDYLVEGRLLGGFAVVAFPAEYGNSGIMTFVVNHEGVVYQKDLGSNTREAAMSISTFDPGEGWTQAAAVEAESAK
jgi:hypothetical protein